MRLKWFRSLAPTIQILISLVLIFFLVIIYVPVSKYIKATITFVLSPSLGLISDVSASAKEFLSFQNITEENKQLNKKIIQLNEQLLRLEEAALENERLRELLALPQKKSYKTTTALVIGKDSSNWTKTVLINQGSSAGIEKGMTVTQGANLAGKVSEVSKSTSKVMLLIDFNSKIPAKIKRTREEGIVFGDFAVKGSLCRIKYIHQVAIGDQVISSGLGGVYPKGLLIGKISEINQEKHKLYKVAEIEPAIDFSKLEEVVVILEK